jgi:hypothetical protein
MAKFNPIPAVDRARGSDFRPPPQVFQFEKVATDTSHNPRALWFNSGVNESDYNALLASLNDAVEIFYRHRTPDPAFVAAFDALKVARAKVVGVALEAHARAPGPDVRAAA